ncbi:asparagine synthase-related protein [Pedobacter sp. L105]|uniref:asparagine synthase-related protein n=1 Tax=Pedobacter sp. L105 TaxID=1641871 RepID=UPI00131C1033|nr:asparagine synthase-related protein [Pedobacter sp. L105]
MSVIFGKCRLDLQPILPDELFVMENRLNHWQADQKAIWSARFIGLGHLMLHNTPQSLAEQLPYYQPDSGLTITADARIDNREDLYRKLDIPPAERLLLPDSLLILKAYEKYGENCAEHLIGDFAFAIWDKHRQKLFCARDQLGVKPFFYYCHNNLFAFASEKKGIMAIPGIDLKINKQFLYNQLVFPVEQAIDTTLYRHIKRLQPAHTLILEPAKKNLRLQRYWDLDVHTETRLGNKSSYEEGLLYHFEQAVECRTRSSYPLGVELSGGMDSSAITAIANNQLKKNGQHLLTFSNTLAAGITDPEITKLDERSYIDAVLEFNDIKDFIYITKTAFDHPIDELNFALEVNDGLERWNPLWQIPIKKAAKSYNTRTLLSGFPGDELVTYRGKYYFLDFLDKKQYLNYWLAKKKYPGFSKLEPFIPHQVKYQLSKIKRYLSVFNDRHTRKAFDQFNIPSYYKQHLRDCLWLDPMHQEQFKSYRHFQRYRLLKPQVNQRLESETRYGIHFRTEPRFPMADIRLAQFYLSMPNAYKYEGELSRTFYRNTVSKYLPPLLMQRNDKYGSVAPFLSQQKKITEAEIARLMSQIPKTSFLKNKLVHRPPVEIWLWLIKNQDWLEQL